MEVHTVFHRIDGVTTITVARRTIAEVYEAIHQLTEDGFELDDSPRVVEDHYTARLVKKTA